MSAGLRQPCSAQARRNGVNTRNGSPSPLRTRPGATAYGEPVRTSSRPSAARPLATASSRRLPYGPKSAARCTEPASTAAAIRGTTSAGSPRTTSSFPPRLASRSRSERYRNVRRAGPAGSSSAGSSTNRANARGAASAAARKIGWSRTRRSRRNQTTEVSDIADDANRTPGSPRVGHPVRVRPNGPFARTYGCERTVRADAGECSGQGRAQPGGERGRVVRATQQGREHQAVQHGGDLGGGRVRVRGPPTDQGLRGEPAQRVAALDQRRAQVGLAHGGQAQLVAGQGPAPLRGGHRHPDPGQHVHQRRRARGQHARQLDRQVQLEQPPDAALDQRRPGAEVVGRAAGRQAGDLVDRAVGQAAQTLLGEQGQRAVEELGATIGHRPLYFCRGKWATISTSVEGEVRWT